MKPQQLRILCIDLRKSRFGFAVLESPAWLLDWGVKESEDSRNDFEAWVHREFDDLLKSYEPTRVVVGAPRDLAGIQDTLLGRTVSETLKVRRIPFRLVRRRHVRGLLRERNKYAIAEAIAQQFPELAPRLPAHPRKIYEPEPYSMTIFDAVSLGLAYPRCKLTARILPTAPANH